MMTINKFKVLLLACLVAFGFSACDNDDLSTQQYQGGVSLNVYGPQPVMRGGILRFLGSNLDQVTQVIIPGVSPITDIDVRQSGVPSEIWVQVPVDGPEEGYVTLVTANGDEITTKTKLTYEEPIVYDGFSPMSVMPGDVLTITGDYLNLMHAVVFTDEVIVPEEEFLEHTRYQIKVVVPAEARTGVVMLSDGQEDMPNLIPSEEELTIGTSTVESFTASRFKAGETVTIKGTRLDLVDYIRFAGVDVPSQALADGTVSPFTLSEDGTQITFTLPAEAASGNVQLVMRSGVEVMASEGLEVVVPSDVTVSANAKNGNALTLSGSDMDLVTSVSFPVADGSTVDAGEIATSASKVSISAVPTTAVDGNIVLHMANGMTVDVPYTLVKPAVTKYSANPVNAGATLTLTGTNLDLVNGVSFGGGSVATPEEGATATSLSVVVPMDSQSGAVTLSLKNGTTVDASSQLNIVEAVFCYVVTVPSEEEAADAGGVCVVEVANADKLTGVQVDGADVQWLLNGNMLHFNVPLTVGSTSVVKLISSNGEVEFTFPFNPTEIPEVSIWTGEWSCTGWSGNQDLAWGGYDWSTVKVGQTIIFVIGFVDPTAGWACVSPRMGSNWANLSISQIDLTPGTEDQRVEFTPTADDLAHLQNDGGLVITGDGFILKEVLIR